MYQQRNQSKLVTVLRWLTFLPAAAAGSVASHWVVTAFYQASLGSFFVDPDSAVKHALLSLIGGLVFGGAFVAIAAYVAPSRQGLVAALASGLLLLATAAVVVWAVSETEWLPMTNALSAAVAGSAVAFNRYSESRVTKRRPEHRAA